MKTISCLMSAATEADVAQLRSSQISINPIGEDALIGASELPGSGQHATAVDPSRDLKRLFVFERKNFGRDFGAAVKRKRRVCGELLRHAFDTYTDRQGNRRVKLKCSSLDYHR